MRFPCHAMAAKNLGPVNFRVPLSKFLTIREGRPSAGTVQSVIRTLTAQEQKVKSFRCETIPIFLVLTA